MAHGLLQFLLVLLLLVFFLYCHHLGFCNRRWIGSLRRMALSCRRRCSWLRWCFGADWRGPLCWQRFSNFFYRCWLGCLCGCFRFIFTVIIPIKEVLIVIERCSTYRSS